MKLGHRATSRSKDPELAKAWREIEELRQLTAHLPPAPPLPVRAPETVAEALQDMNELKTAALRLAVD